MDESVYKWIAVGLAVALLTVAGWSFTSKDISAQQEHMNLREEIKMERARVDFFTQEIGEIKEDLAYIRAVVEELRDSRRSSGN